MSEMIIIFVSLLVINILLFFFGKKEYDKTALDMYEPQKDYPFFSFCAIGFGFMRLIPATEKIWIPSVHRLYQSRYDDEREYKAHMRMFLAQEFSILFMIPLVGLFIIYMAMSNGKGQYVTLLAVLTVFMTCMMVCNMVNKLTSDEKNRIEKIREDFPDMLNRLIILLNSGLPMGKAFVNLGSFDADRPINEEIQRVVLDITNTRDTVYAVGRMQNRCHCVAVSHFFTIVDQAVDKGASGTTLALTNLSLELWEEKRNNVKKKSANLAEKLLIPTFVLLIVTIGIIMAAAFSTMNSL